VQHLAISKMAEDLYLSLSKGEVILSTRDSSGRPTGMTVAWGFFGCLWNEPYFLAAARPYRYTWQGIRDSRRFTVNVLSDAYAEGLRYFGTVSGKSEDKFAKGYFHINEALHDYCAPIKEARLLLDCTVVTANQLQPFFIPEEAIQRFYREDNGYHTIFYGHIDRWHRSEATGEN